MMRQSREYARKAVNKGRIGLLFRILMAAKLLVMVAAASASAHESKSNGQKLYLPLYSSISYLKRDDTHLTVTLSFRNVDANAPITVKSATYFDTSGKKVKDLLEGARTLGPFGSTQVLIRRVEFQGDVGANVVVEWSSTSAVTPPLIEAIMVGFRGAGIFSFTSRAVAID